MLLLAAAGCASPEPRHRSRQTMPSSPPPRAEKVETVVPPPAPSVPQTPPPEEADRGEIVLAYRQENYRAVVEEFDKLLLRYPSHLKGADDLYYLGMSYYYLEENERALKAFFELQNRFPGDPRSGESYLLTARALRRMERRGQALEALDRALRLARDPEERLLVREEKADIFIGEGEYLASLGVLDEAYREGGPEDRVRLTKRIEELLAVMPLDLIGSEVIAGDFAFPGEAVEEVYLRRLGIEGGEALDGPLPLSPSPLPGEAMEDDRRPLIKIGVLVPASGRLETFGREVRRGAALALKSLAAPPFPFRVEEVPIDERDGDGALEALKKVLAAEDIVVLIGPLASSTVERIIGEAERSSLAVFSPTASSPRLAGISLNFFRNCLTLEEFGAKLAEFAVRVLGVLTFVTFAPDDAYGLRYGEIFAEEVARLGGRVLALESYDRSLTDFAKPIQALKKTIGMPDPLPEPVEGGEDKPYELPFEGIFLPGYAEQVGLVVPQLAFHEIDVRKLAVLGANGLNSLRFPETGEEFAEGAFFVDGFFADSPREQVRRFTALYREEYGEAPGTFAAQAYDAVAVVLDQLNRGAVSRRDMLSALEGVHAFPGVAGPTTLHPGGWVERDPFFGMVFKGHLVSVSAAPREGGGDSGALEGPSEQVPTGKFP